MTGYVRIDTVNNIADGNVINAADLDGEFNGVQSAFNSSTGHTHDGSSGEGAPITKLGPVQDVTISATVLGVKTTNTVDLGTSSLKFKDFYLAGTASIGGATTLSAALTYGGVTLSNAVTGTGNMVLSASPTLTGTLTAATITASGTITGNGNWVLGNADTDTITQSASYVTGTVLRSAKAATNTLALAAYDVDGTAYTNLITLTAANAPTLALTSTGVGTINNMSIGATTASTGAFTTLSATGVATFSAGTAALPAITTTGDTNTGIWFPAADTIAFTEGGVESMRIDASGRLAIGSTSVTNGTAFGGGSQVNVAKIASTGYPCFQISTTTGGGSSLQFTNSDTVNGVIGYNASGGVNEFAINNALSGALTLSTNNTERARIDSSGNVGIGTSSPLKPLDVTFAGTSSTRRFLVSYDDSVISIKGANDSNNPETFRIIGDNIRFNTGTSGSGTEAARIDSSGNLLVGGTTAISGAKISVENAGFSAGSSSNTSQTNNLLLGYGYRLGSTLYGQTAITSTYSNSNNYASLEFYTSDTAYAKRMTLDSSGNLLVGKTAVNGSDGGFVLSVGSGTDQSFLATNIRSDGGGEVVVVNRQGSDGTLIQFRQANTEEGTISVSGTTVSYNGGHLSRWAQTTAPKDDTLVKGTVLSNLDAMNVYTDADGVPVANEQLNKVKISDTEGDVNVAGVFVNWTHDEAHNVDEINMAMTGDMIIRIAQGVTVARGDLLMSAGDGTAKPQGDDIVRSKTVAKVTSTHVTCTYADGSYCVPCVLMAC